jgi:hypothetical protein
MEKVTVSSELIVKVLNYLAEQKFRDVASIFLPLEKEIVPQLQVKNEKVED